MFLPMFSIPFLHKTVQSLSAYLGIHWGNDKSVGLRDKMYSNPNMFSVLLVVLFQCFHESRCSLSNSIRLYFNGLKPRYWMVDPQDIVVGE